MNPKTKISISGLQKRASSIGKKSFDSIFLSVCRSFNSRQVVVRKQSNAEINAYYRNAMMCPSGMHLETENFLRGNLLRDRLEKHPREVLQKATEFYQVSDNIIAWLFAADICRYLARKASGRKAVQLYLSAYYYAYLFCKKRKENAKKFYLSSEDFHFVSIIYILNEAMAGIFRYLKQQSLFGFQTFTLDGITGQKFQFEKPIFSLSVPVEQLTDLSLCSDFDVKGLMLTNRQTGGGVPLVASVSSQGLSKSLKMPAGLTIPVTMIIRAQMQADGSMMLGPVFQDTSVSEVLHVEKGRLLEGDWILARDFTTPFACFLSTLERKNLLTAMLTPKKADNRYGLFMVEPYQPGKIPVVFIHGLLSSPETWGDMVNSLKCTAQIRQRYQFWFFSYSTGAPIVASAYDLRNALRAAKEEFCTTPEATENFEKMVLVGHSMGGLISRLLLQQDPKFILENILQASWDEIAQKLSEKEMHDMEQFLMQLPLDFVHRVIFMAVPHRGAAMAQRKIADFGVRLTQLPKNLLAIAEEYRQIYLKLYPGSAPPSAQRIFSGIGNLNPDNKIIAAIGNSPLKQDVTYHSIIGNKDAAGTPGGSDGIVPYKSSHIDCAASEFIVKSNHSVHQTPEAILEVLRILLLHLR